MKFIKRLGLFLLTGLLILIAGTAYERTITLFWAKLFWSPPSAISGLKLGDTKSDAVFRLGAPTKCPDDTEWCYWNMETYSEAFLQIYLDSTDIITSIGASTDSKKLPAANLPFSTIDELKYVLGEEDTKSVSNDFTERLYVFLDKDVAFKFNENRIRFMVIGNDGWTRLRDQSEFYVRGIKLCSDNKICPFDESTGELKPEYEDKSPLDLL